MFNWLKRFWYGTNSSLAEERRKEPEGGIERKGSSKLQGGNVKASSKVGGQSKKSKLSSKDGQRKRPRKGQQGKANTVTSKSKGVGSKQQSGRKSKSKGNKQKKQS